MPFIMKACTLLCSRKDYSHSHATPKEVHVICKTSRIKFNRSDRFQKFKNSFLKEKFSIGIDMNISKKPALLEPCQPFDLLGILKNPTAKVAPPAYFLFNKPETLPKHRKNGACLDWSICYLLKSTADAIFSIIINPLKWRLQCKRILYVTLSTVKSNVAICQNLGCCFTFCIHQREAGVKILRVKREAGVQILRVEEKFEFTGTRISKQPDYSTYSVESFFFLKGYI